MNWDLRSLARQAWGQRHELLFGMERFPAAIVALALFVVAVNLEIAGATDLGSDGLTRLGAATSAAAALATACILFFESRERRGSRIHLLSLGLALGIGAVIWWWRELATAPAALLLATILLVPLGPYTRQRAGFWSFVWALANATALAFLAIAIFCAGVSAILASLDYLFGVDVESSVYGHVWSTGLGFVGPLFALSQVPATFPHADDPDRRDFVVGGARVLADFVAVPLLFVYALILHAYAVKIAVQTELPRGQIGWMVLSLGLAVLALRIIADPFAAFARTPTRLFLRWWALLLPVPLLLLVIGTGERIDAYGVTPERYGLALFGLFLALVLAAQLLRQSRGDIRVIPAAGALLLLATGFGPWGLIDLSARQQTARLYKTLGEAGALEGQRLVAAPEIPADEARSVASIVRLLDEIGQAERLRPLFAGRDDDPFEGPSDQRVREINRILEVDAIPVMRGADGSFWAGPGAPSAVRLDDGFDLVIPYLSWSVDQPPQTVQAGDLAISVTTAEESLTVSADTRTVVLSTAPFRETFESVSSGQDPRKEGTAFPLIVVERDGMRIGVLFDNVGGRLAGEGSVAVNGGRFQLFLREADWR